MSAMHRAPETRCYRAHHCEAGALARLAVNPTTSKLDEIYLRVLTANDVLQSAVDGGKRCTASPSSGLRLERAVTSKDCPNIVVWETSCSNPRWLSTMISDLEGRQEYCNARRCTRRRSPI